MSRASICTFTAAERDGVWCVTRDAVFYGDYNTREQAVASAKAGARAAQSRGLTACVRVQPGDRVVPL